MGLLLLDAEITSVATIAGVASKQTSAIAVSASLFVAARNGRKIAFVLGGRGRTFAVKDPDEVDFINFDFESVLADSGDTLLTYDVAVDDSPDAALLLDRFAASGGVVCARWRAGTASKTYAPRCRITTIKGRTLDLTGSVFISGT